MAEIPGGVRFTGIVAPSDSTDTYAVTDEMYNRGGYRTVANISERLAISLDRRKEGMLVYQKDVQTYYTLENGISDANWKVANLGGGGGASTAIAVSYAPTTSGLVSTNVQAALDEVVDLLNKVKYLDKLKTEFDFFTSVKVCIEIAKNIDCCGKKVKKKVK